VKSNSVFLSVLCCDERSGWIHPGLTLFLIATLKSRPSTQVHLSLDARPTTYARNLIVKNFLASECEWLAMLDNDVVPPVGLLDVLNGAPESASVIVPKVFIPINGFHPAALGWRPIGDTNADLWQELSDCATAAIFIRRNVFSKITAPCFEYGSTPDGAPITEDLMFCRKVREAGLRIFGNRDRSYVCSHFRTLDLRVLGECGPEFNFSTLIEKQSKAAGR
jgi:hypothetical protein